MLYQGYTNGPTYYPQGSFLGYVLYLDFGQLLTERDLSQQDVYTVFEAAARSLAPAGITVTTVYPRRLRPGEFTRAVFDPQASLAWNESDGNSPRKQLKNPTWFDACNVYVAWAGPVLSGYVAAHECAHSVSSFEMTHDETPVDGGPNLMARKLTARGGKLSPKWIKDIRESIARFKRGDRFGFHYVPGTTTGQIRNDWHNIGV